MKKIVVLLFVVCYEWRSPLSLFIAYGGLERRQHINFVSGEEVSDLGKGDKVDINP